MKQLQKISERICAIFLVALMMFQILPLHVLAAEIPDEEVNISTNDVPEDDEGSKFTLVNSDVQISDEYLPETAYISEIENPGYEMELPEREYPEGLVLTKTVGDPMVYLTQRWLNQEYSDVPGFGSVPENGKTGWDTVYGLLRALQHELGITELANNFGPTTSSLYSKKLLYRQDGVTNRMFAILQGALWCKGYSPGYHLYENADGTVSFDEVFDEKVERAIIELKQDAGLINPDGVVTVNVMKALMSMDSFKLLSYYGGDPQIREMQQMLNRKYEAYTGLTPCDGVYGRNTNKALVYALQAEEGLPINVATGNFGTTTKLCCPEIPYGKGTTVARRYPGTPSSLFYTPSQIKSFIQLLQFALLVNGFDTGEIDGIYDDQIGNSILEFQKKLSLPQTGVADKSTWLSLFISCGDTSRSAYAADCATILTPEKAKTLYDHGYRYIGRYLTGRLANGQSKAITREEAEIIFDAGLNFFPIFQTAAYYNDYFTAEQGLDDAESAIDAATKLGIPANTIIYFAVDYDCMDYQITSNVIPYFEAVHSVMSESIYRTGIYGTRNTCSRVSELGYACSSFVGDMSTGFSGNLGFSMPDNWAFDQFHTTSIGSGAGYLEIDKNGFSGKDHGVSKLDEDLSSLQLPEIESNSLESDVLTGPVVNILGNETPLFTFDMDMEEKIINTDRLEVTKDLLNNTIKVSIGLRQVSKDKNEKNENYKDIKALINLLEKVKVGGDPQEALNKYKSLVERLEVRKLDLGFNFNAQLAGILELKKVDGRYVVVEGDLLVIANIGTSLKSPIDPLHPFNPLNKYVFIKCALSGDFTAGLKCKVTDKGLLTAAGGFDLSVALSLGISAGITNLEAYGGVKGTLDVKGVMPAESIAQALEVRLNAEFFLELQILNMNTAYHLKFLDQKLYPLKNRDSILNISQDDFELMKPISKKLVQYENEDPNIVCQNIQTYCLPQIVSLGEGKKFIAYIDDAQNRTAENRTVLLWSMYDGTQWSTPSPILDDATGDFQPVLYADGDGGVHIVWQNAKKVFDPDMSLEEEAYNTELYYTYWDGTSFRNTAAITDNSSYESGFKIAATENEITIVWQQNSRDDLLGMSGTNTVYRRQCINGKWRDIEVIASNLYAINSIDVGYDGAKNVIAYSTKTTDDGTTIDDFEVFYFDGNDVTQVTNNNVPDLSVDFAGSELSWKDNDSIYCLPLGGAGEPQKIVSNLSGDVSQIKFIKSSDEKKIVIWTEKGEKGYRFYATYYDATSGELGTIRPISKNEDYVWGWDACVLPNNQIELLYCRADALSEVSSDRPYGQIDLVQRGEYTYYDLEVGPYVMYNDVISPESTVTLTADVYNNGSANVSDIDVKITAEDGTVLLSEKKQKNIGVGETEQVEILFTVPELIKKMDYTVQVIPHGQTDVCLDDNQGKFTIGYSDLEIKSVEEVRIGTERQMRITITNSGFETVDNATLKIYNGGMNGDVLYNKEITEMKAGETFTYTYVVDSDILYPVGSGDSTLLYISLVTESEEADYANNTYEQHLYPDDLITVVSESGGSVQGAGLFLHRSNVNITATPNPGYIFAGWYENGKLLDAVGAEYSFSVFSNRTLEAKFIPNNLAITNVEIFGPLNINEEMTFTTWAEGGEQPYLWEFSVYKDEEIYYHEECIANVFEWTPMETGVYKVIVRVTDSTGYSASYSKEFSIN